MSITVKIPSPLRPLAGGLAEVNLEGATVGEVLRMLDARHEGFGERVFDDSGVKRFINVYVNEDNIRDSQELETAVKAGDTISILPSIAGGADKTAAATATFCWPELTASDPTAAKAFYCTLFGWTATDSPIGPGGIYTMFELQGKPLGAACEIDAESKNQGSKPHWLSYVSVANVDETIEKAKSFGGTVSAGPFDFMDAGRMSLLLDPSGAEFAVWQPKQSAEAQMADRPGAFLWTELVSANADVAREFYSKLFDWGPQFHERGPAKHTVFLRGKAPAGGKKTIPDLVKLPPTHWLPYFGADNVDDVAKRARKLGGREVVPPSDVPGVCRFSIIQDPQGAAFGIIKFASAPGGK